MRLVIAAILLFVCPLAVSQLIMICLTELMNVSAEQASVIASIGQVVVEAFAAIMIILQLNQENKESQQQSDIEAARFLFEYNQAFLSDADMTGMERLFDKEYMDECEGIPRTNSVIDGSNRQCVVNYLVYLEGFAPLVLNGTLKLENIDDLMSYRFFLAINNPEVQTKHLFAFPDDYRGCFKLYKKWKEYRVKNGREILQAQYSLDHWQYFDLFASDSGTGEVEVQKGIETESYDEVATIMYNADPYIFPAAFLYRSIARKVLPEFFADKEGPFSSRNMYISKSDGRIAGVICYFDSSVKSGFDYKGMREKYPELPESYEYTGENYFGRITENLKEFDGAENGIYIHSFCVAANFRGRGIGDLLLSQLIEDNKSKNMFLHVLADNTSAINLYKKHGFEFVGGVMPGFSVDRENRPDCRAMARYNNR